MYDTQAVGVEIDEQLSRLGIKEGPESTKQRRKKQRKSFLSVSDVTAEDNGNEDSNSIVRGGDDEDNDLTMYEIVGCGRRRHEFLPMQGKDNNGNIFKRLDLRVYIPAIKKIQNSDLKTTCLLKTLKKSQLKRRRDVENANNYNAQSELDDFYAECKEQVYDLGYAQYGNYLYYIS
jgi:hypothetical protein